MCNRYYAPGEREIEEFWQIGRQRPNRWWQDDRITQIFPRSQGPFIRRSIHDAGYSRQGMIGQWALIPPWAKTAKLPYNTNNARAEELADKAAYKLAWAKGQRCVIPAESFDEPNWESGKNEWWRFRRADHQPWALAGLWNRWLDRSSGEWLESYTMLTINADHHPLMSVGRCPKRARASCSGQRMLLIAPCPQTPIRLEPPGLSKPSYFELDAYWGIILDCY